MFEIAFEVMLRLMIGIDERDPGWSAIRGDYRIIDRGHRRRATLLSIVQDRRVRAAIERVEHVWRERAAAFPPVTSGFPRCFYEAVCRVEAGAVHDRTLLDNLVFVTLVSAVDFHGLLQWLCKKLTDNGLWLERLRATAASDPRAAAALADRIVRETLRMEQSEHLYRRVVEPFDFQGFHFPAGWLVRLNVRDIRPLMSHRYHLPPSAHTTFLSSRFVVCTFVPRPFETDPRALKVPFFHNNDDYDEVIFYHAGDFFSRDNIHPGMVTFHPAGFTHGPHPKALQRMFEQTKPATDEYAVMIDARDPLDVMEAGRSVEWAGYVDSWKGAP